VSASGTTIPALAGPLKATLGRVISDRIGELFPAGAMPAGTALKSISFDEVGRGALIARVEAACRKRCSIEFSGDE
jgi:hypothetical protein